MTAGSDLAVTIYLEGGVEVLVRHYVDGVVEADVRGTGYGRTWTPVEMVDGSFEVEHLEPAVKATS